MDRERGIRTAPPRGDRTGLTASPGKTRDGLVPFQDFPVLRFLAEADLKAFEALAIGLECRTEQRIVADPPGEPVVGVIHRGELRLYLVGGLGHELAVGRKQVGALSILGREDLAGGPEVVAEAVTGSVVSLVPAAGLFAAAAGHAEAATDLFGLLWGRIQREEHTLAEVAFCSARSRLAHLLVQMGGSEHSRPMVRVTHDHLARMVGARQDTVTKELHALRAEGLIAFTPHQTRRITLLDPEALARY